MTLQDVISVWISGRPETTATKYQQLIALLDASSHRLFNAGLLELSTPQITALLRATNKGISNRTQSNRLWILKGFYTCAKGLGVRPDSPMVSIRAPRFEDTLAERIITHDQVAAIVAAAKSERDKLLIQLLYFGGLRVSEALHLSRKDMLGDGRLKVFGKGEKTAYVRIQPDLEQKLLAFAPPEGRIFRGRDSSRMDRKTAWHIVKNASAAAGLPNVSPHWFRHAHATEALRRGASLPLVQQSLRHSSVTTTMKYSHIIEGDGAGLYLPSL